MIDASTSGTDFGRWLAGVGWTAIALVSVALAVFSYRYLPKVGPLDRAILANVFARPWLDVHVAGAATALLVGPFQFLKGLRARWPHLHRWIGRVYLAGCYLGGAAGLIMALGSTAGPVATAGFGALAIVWLVATVRAWRLARERRFAEHRTWMIRSWALTLAAVTLRIYLPLIPAGMFDDGYRAISFLCWIPNLVVAEFYLSRTA